MAKSHGKDMYFALDTSGGASKDLSAYVQEVSGLPAEIELHDATVGGAAGAAAGHTWFRGLHKASFSAKFVFDDATDASWDVVSDFHSDTSTRSFIFGPKGTTATYPRVTGECVIKSVTIGAVTTDMNVLTVEFELDGAMTVDAFT